MASFDDLHPCTYFGRWQDILGAVGWLDAGKAYATGPVRQDFFAALVRLLVDPWQPVALAGRSGCAFCRFTGGPSRLTYAGSSVTLGAANLFVPGAERVFVAPSQIVHFIDAHEYCPPFVFQEAVLDCPEMGSFAYLKAMKALGLTT